MYLSLLVFVQLFSEVAPSQPAKPARKQSLTRNTGNSQSGHSRSRILGSLKSRRQTTYRTIITLASSLKYPKKIASENTQNCHSRQPYYRLMPPPRGTSTNIRINLILPETRVIGLHFCCWQYRSIFIQIFVVGAERRIFSATECVSVVQGHPRSLILAPIERAYATFY